LIPRTKRSIQCVMNAFIYYTIQISVSFLFVFNFSPYLSISIFRLLLNRLRLQAVQMRARRELRRSKKKKMKRTSEWKRDNCAKIQLQQHNYILHIFISSRFIFSFSSLSLFVSFFFVLSSSYFISFVLFIIVRVLLYSNERIN
jgi:hypothetical protein